MNRKELKPLIQAHIRRFKAAEKMFKTLDSVLSMEPESPFKELIYEILDAEMTMIELLAGDKFMSVSWYVYDNDCGKSKGECVVDGKKFNCGSVDKLMDMMGIKK